MSESWITRNISNLRTEHYIKSDTYCLLYILKRHAHPANNVRLTDSGRMIDRHTWLTMTDRLAVTDRRCRSRFESNTASVSERDMSGQHHDLPGQQATAFCIRYNRSWKSIWLCNRRPRYWHQQLSSITRQTSSNLLERRRSFSLALFLVEL